MKPIKRSYTTPLRKKIRKSFTRKSADSLVNQKTKKSNTENFLNRSFSKKHKKKKVAPLENGCDMAPEQEMALINTNSCNPVTAFHLTNMRFIVLDSLDVRKGGKQKIKRSVCNIKSNSKKVLNRRKCHIMKKQTFSTPLTLNRISKTKKTKRENKDGILTTTQEITLTRGKLTTENVAQRQQAAGDGEKKLENFFKTKNEDNYSQWIRDKDIIIDHREISTIDAYENVSNTFLDICLPFTFARQKPVEDDVSKIDGKFIRSLMKIARSREVVKTRKIRKIKISKSKSKQNKIKDVDENADFQELFQRSNSERKNKNSKQNAKKRLHQAQNIFFLTHSEREYQPDNSFYGQKAKEDNQAFIIRKIKLQNPNFKNSKPDEIHLGQTKSEKFKIKMATKQDDRRQKSRSVNSRMQKTNVKEPSLDEDEVNITELWRNETRVASDNSLSIHSSSSTDQKKNDYPVDYEMKSYKALVKIVKEEVQRICKYRQASNKTTESKELSIVNAKETVKLAEKWKKPSETSIVVNENKPKSKNSHSVFISQQKLTTFVPEKLNKSLQEEKTETPQNNDAELLNKQDKLNELKTKLNFLAEETHDSGKIQSEIVKNWSVIRRLEKAFLALGTPGFPNKNNKSPSGTFIQGTPKDSDLRKYYSPDKMIRTKAKTTCNYEELQAKSQIPVLSSGKHDATTNKRGCEQFPKTERREGGRKLIRSEDLDKSDIYFFSFEPNGRRKSSAKAWLEKLDKKKLEKIVVPDNEFSGKSNSGTSNKKKVKDGDKEMQGLGHGAKPGNEVDKLWFKAPGKFKNYILPTEIEIKPTQHVFEKHSTYTILPPLTKTDSEIFVNGSSSRTYIIDSEEEKIDSSAILERKKTFAVLSAKNLVAVVPTKNAKNQYNSVSQQKATKDIVSNGNSDLKINNSKILNKPPTIPKSENQVKKNDENDKKSGKSNLDFIRKNYLKMKRNKQKRQENQEENKKNLIPWNDSVDGTQCSKTSILTIGKSDHNDHNATPKVKLRHKNKAFDTYAATPIDSQIEPLMVLIHRNLEQPSSFHHRMCDPSASTETYKVSGSSDRLEIMSSPKIGFPEMPMTSSTTFRMSKGVRDVKTSKIKSERCHWEEDIQQYRQIVKDIISQYQRTHDFLKQSQQISKFRRMRDPETEAGDRHFAGQVSNIAEYRKKIMSEYNAMPLVDYKSQFLKEESGRSSRRGESLASRNLYVAKNMTEDVDSDVKDYLPNVHKILDSQMYVEDKKISRKVKAGNGKQFEKAMSLQTLVQHHGGRGKPPEKKNEDQMEESKSSKKLENEILSADSRYRKIVEKENAPIEWITIKALNSSSNENGESRPFVCFKS